MKWPALLPIAFLPATVFAQDSTVARPSPEQFMASLHPVSGSVAIGDGIATLQLPDSYRYVDPQGSRRLLVDAWGNPPDAVEGTLGVLFPTSTDLLSAEGWAVIISYDQDGYVDDSGAEAINYDSLLRQIRKRRWTTVCASSADAECWCSMRWLRSKPCHASSNPCSR